jgi:hypothetical protein
MDQNYKQFLKNRHSKEAKQHIHHMLLLTLNMQDKGYLCNFGGWLLLWVRYADGNTTIQEHQTLNLTEC